ncbi:MAG: hypothetical protein AABY30_02350, partial [Candidatus Thermoplasmatota archaeon]
LVIGGVLLFVPLACFVGIPLAIVGFVLLLVGAIMEGPRPVYAYPMPYAVPPYQPVQPPVAQAPPVCPRCGQPVTFVAQYQRWYCQAENLYPWG